MYFEKEYICSITLAGAAEEVLGKLVEYSTPNKNILSEIRENISASWGFRETDIIKNLNGARNLLKHFPDQEQVSFKPVDDSILMILRGIENYKKLKGGVSQIMHSFCQDEHVTKSLQAIIDQ